MQRVNEFRYYELATHIHPLVSIPDPATYRFVWYQWWQARESLNGIFNERPLSITLPIGTKLFTAITEVVPTDWTEAVAKLGKPESEEPIQRYQAARIMDAAREFETILAAECLALDTYLVSQKGSHSTGDLIQQAHINIPEPMQSQLPEQAKLDFDESGRCIAFDLGTAAAFHLMRGTEAVIRLYYEQVTGKAPKLTMRNWGAYIKRLRECNADERVTSFLDHIRKSYRNPVLHPDSNVTPEQALVLFGACISVVVLMMSEKARLAAKSLAPLPFAQTAGSLP